MNQPEFEKSASPSSFIDVMNLPDEPRQLANLIIHQQKVSLTQVITHLNIAAEVAQQHLQNLKNQGFIQEVNENGSIYYQPCFSTPKKSKLSQNIWDKLEE
ncbi:ArsR family transcriptional regulator [Nostoc sp. FACHB-110]|uniref:ArsR family transcriptional regulator n=1 Tax=Nostoc sp. FACHB-110 TaxID=2692834 RepID=UPI001688383A|nr:ArsR family transcriptional regulator [Nostoc sp. FACHB-110]MBD2440153.1 ArsR family transcriptional regulator [Nostoc sp. FACHB-110]